MKYDEKRVILLAGHYGSGKTNLAVHWALQLKALGHRVRIADLDIVNPYYRTKDSEKELRAAGIELISSSFANTNVDLPALPQGMYALLDDRSSYAVIDVGGDDRGALALGRLTEGILAENNYEMLLVYNRYRPLTQTAAQLQQVRAEIEAACGIPFTGMINNANLGAETDADVVLRSLAHARACSRELGLPLRGNALPEQLMPSLVGQVPDAIALQLQKRPIDL